MKEISVIGETTKCSPPQGFLAAAAPLFFSLCGICFGTHIDKCRKFTLFRHTARAARGAACMRRTRREGSSPFPS